MRRRTLLGLTAVALAASAVPRLTTAAPAPARATKPAPAAEAAVAPDIEKRLAQFSPTPIEADVSALGASDRHVLDLLVQAAREIDQVFLRQAWTGNPKLRAELAHRKGAQAKAALLYFDVNSGPWDRLDELKPFVGDHPHPKGAGFYPEDMTKEEFEGWIAKHPGDREAFLSTNTVIHRHGSDLVAVPFAKEYRTWLEPAAKKLKEAAAAAHNPTLKRFLTLRAKAFLSDDYFASDMAWMDLDAPVEVTIGPYETYEDVLFGYKASFEAYVTVPLVKESAALSRYKEQLPWLERNLPIPDKFKNLNRGAESPIRVVDTVFAAGDSKAGVQAIAYNLPNDERVREAKGSKKILLHNVMKAKYDKILQPIATRVLDPQQVADVSFEAYFNETLHHELSHGLGPGTITIDGRKTEVRLELKDLYSTLEEAKADVMGIYNILALIERGAMPKELRRSLEPTYVAGLFRAARFGLEEAHGQGTVAQFNYLLQKGALVVDDQARFRAVSEKFPGAIKDLLAEMLTLQATGDYAGTKRFLETYGKATPKLVQAVGKLTDLPVDIRPIYAAEKAVAAPGAKKGVKKGS